MLLDYDKELLLWINGHSHEVLDAAMFAISGRPFWLPVILALLVFIFYKKSHREGLIFVLCFLACALVCDQLSSGIAKPLFERLRPTHDESLKGLIRTVYGYRGGLYGFFSGHAANFFTGATLLSLVVRHRPHTLLLLAIATLVSYSRIYLGVHYPSDILVGAITGVLVAWLIYSTMYRWLRERYSPTGMLPAQQVFAVGYRMWLVVLVLLVPYLICTALLML